MTQPLTIVSYLSPNLFWFYEAVGAFLQRALAHPVQVFQGAVDPLDDPHLLNGQLDLSFICGLPFARHHRAAPTQFAAIAAPVLCADRYQHQPVYFSDVIVHVNSPFTAFDQLADRVFCYNDLGSNSGYHAVLRYLAQRGYPADFLSQTIPSGSHQQSIAWVASGQAGWAAIDSVVLEQELHDRIDLAQHLRVIESIGPCPIPPLIAAQRLGSLIPQIQSALLHPDRLFQQQMQQARIDRFAGVTSEVYAPLADGIPGLYTAKPGL